MTYQWTMSGAACPIVEFHDLNTERFAAARYIEAIEDDLQPVLAAKGVVPMGQFRVAGHPDRLVLLRGFSGMLARRRALTAFHESPQWAALRQEMTGLERRAEVLLTRAISPAEGVGPLRVSGPVAMLRSETRFAEQIGNYHLWLRLLLRKAGLAPIAAFATLEAVNDVPAVPVVRDRTFHITLLPAGARLPELPAELRGMLRFAPELLELEPTLSLVA